MPDDQKLTYIKNIAKYVENHINDKVYNHVQMNIYNSTEEDFRITYEQEKIAKSGLFIKKKKYATHTIIEDGMAKDKISITGLEIIRSDTPVLFKKALNEILDMILRNHSDDEIKKVTNDYIKEAKKLDPTELSSNIGVNNLKKYIDFKDYSYKKGTPWHIKGVANFLKILNYLNIQNEYPHPEEGVKAKVIYVKDNQYGIDSITYQKWPEKEFAKIGIVPDYDKMIDKFFTSKVKYLLSPMGKEDILNGNENLSLFF